MQVIPSGTSRDAADAVVNFQVDADAQPGDVVPTLARLLIGIDRRHRERATAETAAERQTTQRIPDHP